MDGNPPGASEGYGHPGRPYPISVFDMTTSYKNSQPRVSSTLKPRADGRKKFTTEQTLEMEMLFRENTHPSRDQRLDLAKSFDVGEKSIGIWFQNRRQAVRRERKQSDLKADATSSPPPRPTLERAVTQKELPPPRGRPATNASYHPDHTPHIWGHMMSSPSPPGSPHDLPVSSASSSSSIQDRSISRTRSVSPTRLAPRAAAGIVRAHSDIGVQRTQHSRPRPRAAPRVTLEWACANVGRLPPSPLGQPDSDVLPHVSSPSTGGRSNAGLGNVEEELDDNSETETEAETRTEFSEDIEAITPSEGRSFASVGVASGSGTFSPRGSFSSDGAGPSASAPHRTRDGLELWPVQGAGRTIRNPYMPTKTSTLAAPRSGTNKSTNAPPAGIAPTNSPEEIEAAWALAELFKSGRT